MVRLTRLKIDRFRNVKPGTDLYFGPTFNVLLGKNATGKTTLLDLIAAVTNDDLSAYAKEDAGFDLTWWVEQDQERMKVRTARAPTKSEAATFKVHDEEETHFDDSWTISLESDESQNGAMNVNRARGTFSPRVGPARHFDVREGLATPGFIEHALLASGVEDGFVEYIWAMLTTRRNIGRFDEALAALDKITGSSFEFSRKGSRVTRGSLTNWLPTDLIKMIRNQTSDEPFVVSFEKIGSLREIPALLGFDSAQLRARLFRHSQDAEKKTTSYHGFDLLFHHPDGSRISHELLSSGQKRLLAFLWYLAVRGRLPVVADELLNGLHHDWIQICLDRLYERQSFLATQHPYLLDHVPIDTAQAVTKTFVRCTLEADPSGRKQMVWRNFTEDEAERFFVAYQTGIPQVSEVLRVEGLW
jgi:hypothetical protein